ncbi:hypothetical protein AAON49_11725 [Pseudotenacibaculum sp. MALMAid0570]|uniref:DUF6913 domain-containing protein n=1 Tax=Pseudotenacibaculum sp. MALMAid0570 TaxID=3143938 RepID=UPI0032E04458
MVSAKLRQHFIQKKIAKLLKQQTHKKNGSNKKIFSVGILSDEKLSNQFNLQDIVSENLEVRNPKLYNYRKFDKNLEKSYKHFSEKDFDWKGEIIDTSLKSFVDEPLDLLICFYPKKKTYLQYLTLLSNATFKVGLANIHNQLFDLEVAVEMSEIDNFLAETKKYLKILNKL